MEVLKAAGATLHLRPDVRSWLQNPLSEDFASIRDRQSVPGRTPHFICRPSGAPFSILVRTPTRGGIWSFLGWRHFTIGRVRRELEALKIAAEARLQVPELLAYQVRGGLFKKITCVYGVLEGALTFDEALSRRSASSRWDLLGRVAAEIRKLHFAGLRHGDLNVRNILVGPGDRVSFVDFDGAYRASGSGFSEVARLCRSIEKTMTGRMMATDKARLIRAYIDPKWPLKPSLARCERAMGRHRCWWKVTGA